MTKGLRQGNIGICFSRVLPPVFFTPKASGAIPRGIATSGPALLSYGFRPFFLFAGLWAAAAMALWVAALTLGWPVGGAYGPVNWHAHEMVLGYTSAALAGFMLTAIPNWTGRLPVSGLPLLGLVLVWLAGRTAMLFPGVLGLEVSLGIEAAFLPLLFLVALREIVAGRNWKNLKIVLPLAVLSGANIWFHVAVATGGDSSMAGRLAVGCWIVLIALVGGRIVPSFTRNWLARQGSKTLPIPFGRFDQIAIAAMIVALLAWVAAPFAAASIIACLAAALLQGVRLWRWRGWLAACEPIVFILHIAYGFVVLGLFAVAAAGTGLMSEASAIHVFTVGAIGGMTLAVMSRAALGHTGRAIRASTATVAAYVFLSAAAIIRPASDLFPQYYYTVFALSGLLWLLAFVAFLVVYAPILLAPRVAKSDRA